MLDRKSHLLKALDHQWLVITDKHTKVHILGMWDNVTLSKPSCQSKQYKDYLAVHYSVRIKLYITV